MLLRNEIRRRAPINRRLFLRNAGVVAAGCAFGSALTGCNGAIEIPIPCLGPAAAPTPVAGMSYIRASEIGCALDCDLGSGRNKHTGGQATDDGPRINAAMAGATADHPITLIIDGSALISGLFLPAGGNWSIAGLGCGTGFFLKSATNNDGIHNGPPDAAIPFDPGPPAPPRGANVSLSNFTLNGNQGDGHSGNSTSGLRQGNDAAWFCGINLMNLNNITIENVVVVNTAAYHVRLSNVGNVTATGCIMQSVGLSTDGLHFDGPANDITITNCSFSTGDDSIALNCPEGYSGDISNVTVTGCKFQSLSLMRLYTTVWGTKSCRINNVSLSNCTGTLTEAVFLIGLSNGSLPDSVGSLTFSDSVVTAPVVLGMAENFGTITLKNITFTPSQSIFAWVSPQVNHVCAFLRPSPLYGYQTFVGSNLVFENCTLVNGSNSNVVAVVLANESKINNFSVNGFAVQNAASSTSMAGMLDLEGGTIQGLVLDSLSSKGIPAPVNMGGFGSIGLVSGGGVLGTGWEFPDAVMADNVPYISASTGKPSIKVAGVVQPYGV